MYTLNMDLKKVFNCLAGQYTLFTKLHFSRKLQLPLLLFKIDYLYLGVQREGNPSQETHQPNHIIRNFVPGHSRPFYCPSPQHQPLPSLLSSVPVRLSYIPLLVLSYCMPKHNRSGKEWNDIKTDCYPDYLSPPLIRSFFPLFPYFSYLYSLLSFLFHAPSSFLAAVLLEVGYIFVILYLW